MIWYVDTCNTIVRFVIAAFVEEVESLYIHTVYAVNLPIFQ